MIGDPSGRTDMRQMMTKETIQHNCECFKEQMSRFIDFSDDKALLVNNADWLREKAITVAEVVKMSFSFFNLIISYIDPRILLRIYQMKHHKTSPN